MTVLSRFEARLFQGRLVYLLVALEDYEKDWRGGEFNAFRAAFGWATESLTADQRRRGRGGRWNSVSESSTESPRCRFPGLMRRFSPNDWITTFVVAKDVAATAIAAM